MQFKQQKKMSETLENQWETNAVQLKSAESEELKSLHARVRQLEETCLMFSEIIKDCTNNNPDTLTNRNMATDFPELSTEKIDNFVDALLANDSNNLAWIPDALEKGLNRRIFLLALGALRQALLSASVEVLGRKLTFSLRPSEKEDEQVGAEKEAGQLDEIVKFALRSILSTAQVQVLGHEISFQLQ